ncbi:hypothetical protein [Pseudomonas sp. BN411]|uniref:hypothetical protein n=1 Tax=Pseudomonas sp. BN411 TaxID=2567887 RepID=UPI002453DE1B|nr:hypothetical protein [Pseudomonas sp. BN411]MDH4564249.1 hypothetical protein [Pseudomonas sp. BN411]
MADVNEDSVTLQPYYAALNRLVAGKSMIVPKGSRITLNAVALEAGKTAGSIKKSRPIFDALIREIHIRAKQQAEQSAPGALKVRQANQKAEKARASAESFEDKYKAALARELMLLRAWDKAQQHLRKTNNVVPLNPSKRK